MYILGVSFDYHDAAAALIRDGEVVAAAHEERFTRKKNDPSLPRNAIDFCLREAGIKPGALDWIVHYEHPLLKFDRILLTALKTFPKSKIFLKDTFFDWVQQGKFFVRRRLSEALGVPATRIVYGRHHRSHAAAAFFCSPFEEAAIVTLDGVGEYDTATIAHGRGNAIQQLSSVRFPNSVGLFYSAFTAYGGFEVNEGEYKLMGMAAFGQPEYYDRVRELFELRDDGRFRLKQQLFDFLLPEELPFNERLVERFGQPRKPETPFDPFIADDEERRREDLHFAAVAASAQKVTEEVMLHVVSAAIERTGQDAVCMAGGVALNSVANGRIKRELGCRLYVHPAAGDAGNAIGAALHHYHVELGQPRSVCPLRNIYLGRGTHEDEIVSAIEEAFLEPAVVFDNDEDLVGRVADLLRDGGVVGWMQGRAEWGPRALGARSILASPLSAEMQNIVNERIKFREPFRPFAPSVLRERAEEFFELPTIATDLDPEMFMLSVVSVRPEARERIPAVTHVDGSARVHLVDRAVNQIYYDLIAAFGERTGTPILLNTSFNLRGEPMVDTPADAIRTFQWSDMDALVLGRHLLMKDKLDI